MGKDRGHTHSGEDPSEVPKMWCELSLFLKRNLLQLEFSEVQEIVLKRRKKFVLFYAFPASVTLHFTMLCIIAIGFISLDKWN